MPWRAVINEPENSILEKRAFIREGAFIRIDMLFILNIGTP